jgi:uncharacterized protein (UPF0261 family)
MVFHTSGTGGMALEELVKQGMIDGVLDISTTEVTDEAIGGVLTAGPHRMEAAGAMGIPQVIIPGAIDLINFKTPDTVPEKDGVFIATPHITLMRTDVEESIARPGLCGEDQSRGELPVLILKGFAAYDNPKGLKATTSRSPFHPGQPEATATRLKKRS